MIEKKTTRELYEGYIKDYSTWTNYDKVWVSRDSILQWLNTDVWKSKEDFIKELEK